MSNIFYENARDDIVKHYSRSDSVISIYEYGSVSAPGVSDLDIILVLKDKVNAIESDLDFKNINEDVYSLVADGIVIKMPEHVFSKIHRFDRLRFKRLFGKEIRVEEYIDSKVINMISVVDWLPERVLRLTKVLLADEINVSNVLCVLHSFLYSIEKINDMAGDAGSENVINNVRKLRSDWYDLDKPEEMLRRCIIESIRLGYQYISMLQEYIESAGHIKSIQSQSVDGAQLELYDNCYIKFSSNIGEGDLMQKAIDSSDAENTFVIISDFYYPHFYFLSLQNGGLSSAIKSKIKPYFRLGDSCLSVEYEAILRNKINLAEDNAVFLKRNGYKKGLIRYGFHFRY